MRKGSITEGFTLVLRAQPHPQFLKWYKTFSWLFGSQKPNYIYIKSIPENVKNNYMEGSGSATINNVAHPKHPEEEETSPNRNHIITGKQQQAN